MTNSILFKRTVRNSMNNSILLCALTVLKRSNGLFSLTSHLIFGSGTQKPPSPISKILPQLSQTTFIHRFHLFPCIDSHISIRVKSPNFTDFSQIPKNPHSLHPKSVHMGKRKAPARREEEEDASPRREVRSKQRHE